MTSGTNWALGPALANSAHHPTPLAEPHSVRMGGVPITWPTVDENREIPIQRAFICVSSSSCCLVGGRWSGHPISIHAHMFAQQCSCSPLPDQEKVMTPEGSSGPQQLGVEEESL